jgi:hypothetical protein
MIIILINRKNHFMDFFEFFFFFFEFYFDTIHLMLKYSFL